MIRRLLWLAVFSLLTAPSPAMAHDDPVVTVRVLCDGFNVLNMDQVLGEISDSATLNVDGTVQGAQQIQGWVKQQMDDDLRIQIVDIGTPQRLPDGYTLTWTARLSRQDWRKAGIEARQASNTVVIHNGRITEWTAKLDVGAAAATGLAAPASVSTPEVSSPIPYIFGVPVTLVLAGVLALCGGTFVARGALRR